jgi:hypothetical protein
LRQLFDVTLVSLGDHHPAQAPARHLKIFGEAVDYPDVVTSSASRWRIYFIPQWAFLRGVGQAVVDLINQKMAFQLATGFGQRLDFR